MNLPAKIWVLPLVLLSLGLVGGWGASAGSRASSLAEEQHRFADLADRAIDQLQQRIQLYEYGLRGTRGAIIGADGDLPHPRFVAYMRSRDLAREFPGSLGYGFVRRVSPAAEAAFVEANRRDGQPGFTVRQLAPHEGERWIIQYIEPLATNAAAVGLDIASEPSRRAAALDAMRTGKATITAPIALVQTNGADATGFLMLLPVVTPDATIGWAYTPLSIRQVMGDFDYRNGEFAMRIVDVTSSDFGVPLYRSPGEGGATPHDLVVTRTLRIYGRSWQVELRALPAFVTALNLPDPAKVGSGVVAGAVFCSGALLAYLWILRRGHQEEVERERIQFQSERSLRDLAESIPHLVWTCDHEGACDYLSPQWVAYTGVAERKQLGFGWLEHLHPDDVVPTREGWARAAATGTVFDTEFRIRRHDGEYRWFKTRARPTFDEAGRLVKWFGSNTDIQDLRDAHEMMAGLNHDLESRVLTRTAELEAVAAQLRVAQRISHVGSWEIDLLTERLSWSEELFRIGGREPQREPPDYAAQEAMLTPASWADLARAVTASRTTGAGFVLDLDVVRPDGARRTAVARIEAVRDATDRVVRLTGTLQDVTEIVLARSELVELSERLQLATSAANMGIWDWNVKDDVVVWDETTYRLFGIVPGTFNVAPGAWRTVLHPDDRVSFDTTLRTALDASAAFTTEFRIVRPDGDVRHLRVVAAIHHDPATGRALRVVGVNWDVTAQRQVDLALRESEGVLRGILAHAGSAIIAADPDGTITHFNHAAEQLLGYQAEEMIGSCSPGAFHVADEIDARRVVLEHELGSPIGSPFEVFVVKARLGRADATEWTYVRKDGVRVPVLLTVSTLRDDRGQIFGYLGVAIDLTTRKAQEERLVTLNGLLAERSAQAESANQAKTLFLANMSHEIRTPMNAITGVTHLLTQSTLDADQRSLLGIVQRASRTLLGMINDILDLSKIEAGQLTLDVVPFSLERLVDDLRQVMKAYAAGRDLELVVDSDPEWAWTLHGDPLRLTQILGNLLSNAIRFTDSGRVCLRIRGAELPSGEVQMTFEVQDTGVGMDEVLLGRLFSPFTQAAGVGARAGGTGLGLTIVDQLVHLMGGEVSVTSTPGVGSRFRVVIPFSSAEPQTPTPIGVEVRTRGRLFGTRLLVADDSDVNLEVARRILELEGAEVETVDSGRAAVERVRTTRFDAVLMDIQMADLDGVEATIRIRAMPAGIGDVPILAVTAWALASERERAMTAGVDAFVSKPFDPVNMVLRVREHVERHRGIEPDEIPDPLEQGVNGGWPRLDGIDTHDASHRFGNDVQLFQLLLGRVLAEFGDLDGGADRAELAARAHKLRGAAGNLGARALERAARELEQLARSGVGSIVAEAVASVRVELERLRRAALSCVVVPVAPVDWSPRDETVADLVRLLEAHDLGALDLYAIVHRELVETRGDEVSQRVGAAIDALEFEVALALVAKEGLVPT